MVITITELEIDEAVRTYRKPIITFMLLAEMFGDDEEARKLAQKRIRSLTIQVNKLLRPSHIIDRDVRWVVDELNKLQAEPLQKEIQFYKNFLATVTADKTTTEGSVTEEQILRAKEYPIVDLLESFGVEFHRSFATCPWHGEKTASLHHIKDRNTVYCHGCHKHADTIEVMRHFKSIGFVEAVRQLV
jgi:hypothetical protein